VPKVVADTNSLKNEGWKPWCG